MRLWSFGDCSSNFPSAESPEHKQCVRMVGSDEARDARAVHFCNASHAKDAAEASRCREKYLANKSAAEQEGLRARLTNPVPGPAAAAPAPQRDKEAGVAALTRALKTLEPETPTPAPEAASAPPAAAAPAPPPASGSISNVPLGFGIILLLAAMALRHLRDGTLSGVAADRKVRRSGHAKTSGGIRFAR